MEKTSESITVQTGAEFTISLQSTPSSGAIWYMGQLPDGLSFIEEKRAVRDSIGSETSQIFTFYARNPGSYTLKFEYKRTWEQEIRKQKDISVQVL